MVCRGRKRTHTLIAKAIYEAPGAVVLVVCTVKCSEILAHIELPKNPRVNKVFYSIYMSEIISSNQIESFGFGERRKFTRSVRLWLNGIIVKGPNTTLPILQ